MKAQPIGGSLGSQAEALQRRPVRSHRRAQPRLGIRRRIGGVHVEAERWGPLVKKIGFTADS